MGGPRGRVHFQGHGRAASGIGGKLGRSYACLDMGMPTAALLNRYKALKRAHIVKSRFEIIRIYDSKNTDIMVGLELVERMIYLIRAGK